MLQRYRSIAAVLDSNNFLEIIKAVEVVLKSDIKGRSNNFQLQNLQEEVKGQYRIQVRRQSLKNS